MNTVHSKSVSLFNVYVNYAKLLNLSAQCILM